MPVAVLNDLFQLTMVGQDSFSIFENVRHYKCTAVNGTSAEYSLLAGYFASIMQTNYPDCISDQITLQNVTLVKVNASGQPLSDPLIYTTGFPIDGNLSGDPLPAFTAAVLSLRTGTAGRRNRGRFYAFYANEAANDAAGFLTAGYKTSMETLGSVLDDATVIGGGGNTATMTPVVLSKVGGTQLPILSTIARIAWGTQRHRKLGRGM